MAKYTKELYKKGLNDPNNQNDVVRARHPGIGSQVNIGSQVGLRKHYYEQSQWRWRNSSWAILNPKRRCCESTALDMPENMESSELATGLEKVSFHSNPKVRQCQRMFKLLYNCTHFTCYKIMLKVLQARLQQDVNWELLDVQAGFRKGWTRDQIASMLWHRKKKGILLLHWLC